MNGLNYYLDTSAIYSLGKKIDSINKRNVYISILNIQEILSKTLDKTEYYKRKTTISKIVNLKLCDLLPEECIATAFGLDISNLEEIKKRKEDIFYELKLFSESTSYEHYKRNIEKYYGEFAEVIYDRTKSNKKYIQKVLNNIYKDIFKKYKKENIENISNNSLKNNEYDILAMNHEQRNKCIHILLKSFLENINIIAEEKKLIEISSEYNGELDTYLDAIYLYSYKRSSRCENAEKNDIVDLYHLLYMRSKKDVIVSNDNIYNYIINENQKMNPEKFLERIDVGV